MDEFETNTQYAYSHVSVAVRGCEKSAGHVIVVETSKSITYASIPRLSLYP